VRLTIKPQISGRRANQCSLIGNKKAENSFNAKTMPSKLFKMNLDLGEGFSHAFPKSLQLFGIML
jgi:hypothetical protein